MSQSSVRPRSITCLQESDKLLFHRPPIARHQRKSTRLKVSLWLCCCCNTYFCKGLMLLHSLLQSSWIYAFPLSNKEFSVESTSLMGFLLHKFLPYFFFRKLPSSSKQWKTADSPRAEEVLRGKSDSVKTSSPRRDTHPEVIRKLRIVCENLGTGTCCFGSYIWMGQKGFIVICCLSICPLVFLWNRTSTYIDLPLKWSHKPFFFTSRLWNSQTRLPPFACPWLSCLEFAH